MASSSVPSDLPTMSNGKEARIKTATPTWTRRMVSSPILPQPCADAATVLGD